MFLARNALQLTRFRVGKRFYSTSIYFSPIAAPRWQRSGHCCSLARRQPLSTHGGNHCDYREAIVNAVCHRDYTSTVTDIELSLYSDRLEFISPGNLPNTVTGPKMRQGYRAAGNELLKEILRDYGYVENRGMGVRRKIIEGRREHIGSEPDLVEEEDRFIVRLWKRKT